METGDYPFLLAINNNNSDIINTLIKYADKNNIKLNFKSKDRNNGECLAWWALINLNPEIARILINYANKNKINLNVMGRDISEFKDDQGLLKIDISELIKYYEETRNLKYFTNYSNIFDDIEDINENVKGTLYEAMNDTTSSVKLLLDNVTFLDINETN